MPLVPAIINTKRYSRGDATDQNKIFDAVVFDILRVTAEDVSNQLTLIDIPLFKAIRPEELSCCEWGGKKKYDLCPNVVSFVKRFNQVSFWVTREILDTNTAKTRASKVAHFVRIGKKLLEVGNVNCSKAVVCSLRSAPIYRLTKTWNLVPKREKEKLDKLHDIVSEDNNNQMLRDYLKSVKLPCIPYLGMYLTDLTYINTIHPNTGGLDEVRCEKMNEILRTISDFQHSEYHHLTPIHHIQTYLKQLKYIDELQKFVEDDNYKLSLRIEPNAKLFSRDTESKRSSAVWHVPLDNSELDGDMLDKSTTEINIDLYQNAAGCVGKDNDSYVSLNSNDSISSSVFYFPLSAYGCSSDQEHSDTHSLILDTEELQESTLPNPCIYWNRLRLEGFFKRKTSLRKGSRPNITKWRRLWVGLTSCSGHLVYFLPKHTSSFGNGCDRNCFSSDPYKVVSVKGCSAFVCSQGDTFKLTSGNGDWVYIFRAGSEQSARMWCEAINEVGEGGKPQPVNDLIDFGDV